MDLERDDSGNIERLLLPFVDGTVASWNNDTLEAIALYGWAIENMHLLKEFCHVTLNDSYGVAHTVNKLLRRLGLRTIETRVHQAKAFQISGVALERGEAIALIEERIAKPLREQFAVSRSTAGRPATGGTAVSFRLPPWLIIHYGLKPATNQNDAPRIKAAIKRAVLYLREHPDGAIANLTGIKGAIARSKLGWGDRVIKFHIWFDTSTLEFIRESAIAGEWKEGDVETGLMGKPTSGMIARLLVIAAALDGVFEPPDGYPLITFDRYQKK